MKELKCWRNNFTSFRSTLTTFWWDFSDNSQLTDQWKSPCAQKSKYSTLTQAGYNNNHIRGWAQPWVRPWNLFLLRPAPQADWCHVLQRAWPNTWLDLLWYLPSGRSKHLCHPVRRQCPFITAIISGRSGVSPSVCFSCLIWQCPTIHSLWLHVKIYKIWLWHSDIM